jgi:hypothetical protein
MCYSFYLKITDDVNNENSSNSYAIKYYFLWIFFSFYNLILEIILFTLLNFAIII